MQPKPRIITIDTSKLTELAEKVSAEHETHFGTGLYVEMTDCCNAPILTKTGGVVTHYCSKCGQYYIHRMFRPLKNSE